MIVFINCLFGLIYRELFFTSAGQLKKPGDLVKWPKLATTLERIAFNYSDFYNGSLAKDIVDDIRDNGQYL